MQDDWLRILRFCLTVTSRFDEDGHGWVDVGSSAVSTKLTQLFLHLRFHSGSHCFPPTAPYLGKNSQDETRPPREVHHRLPPSQAPSFLPVAFHNIAAESQAGSFLLSPPSE